MNKRALVEKIVAALEADVAVLVASAMSAREGSTHEEAKAEDDKDTRAIEAGYLAGAQAKRAHELEAAAERLKAMELRAFGPKDPIALSALVEVERAGKPAHYFLATAGGGLKVRLDGLEVQVLTPEAPLGELMVGKTRGDVLEMNGREIEIVAVR
ncbi:MAG TPA: hypothetical protein VMV18_06860 [bacterium]|nr:hypothetical protein [bacterium]